MDTIHIAASLAIDEQTQIPYGPLLLIVINWLDKEL